MHVFERKSMEQIVADMIRWTRGTTTRITDFRVGSKARTLYEAVGVAIEELYDKAYRAMKSIIEENIYAVLGFDKLPSTFSSGYVRVSKATPAENNIFIPAGTELLSRATQYRAPTKYRTTIDALLQVGYTYVDVPVVANIPGEDGDAGAGEIAEFVQKPVGVDSVTNVTAILGGRPEETKEEQKLRFQTFIEANARGILQSIQYGATLATVTDEQGAIVESVKQAKALEYLPERKGEVDVYIWNGIGEASEELKANAVKSIYGYYDANGRPIYGYKAGGIILNLYTAPLKHIQLKIDLTPESWSTEEIIRVDAERTVDMFFDSLKLGEELIQSQLEAEIKYLEGVKDVKLYLSVEGGEYLMDNVVPGAFEVVVADKPILWGVA